MNYATTSSLRNAHSDAVRKTLANTFWTVGAMLAITGVASLFTMDMKLGLMAHLGLFAASLALLFATNAFRDSGFGLVLLAAFAGIQGVTLGPLLSHYLAMKGGASVVSLAAGLTALATFACATYASVSRRDFSRWGSFLTVGTLLLLVALIVGIFVPIPALHLTISAIGALLFTAWLLYDIGAIVNGQQTNYISAAIGIYLDILNLFLHLLRLLGILSND